MTVADTFEVLGILVASAPALLLVVLGGTMLLGRKLSERATALWTEVLIVIGLVCAIAVLAMMLLTGIREVPVEVGNLVEIRDEHFHFHLKFVFDRLSVPFVILTFVLVGTIGAFANRYLHRDQGYGRFFLLYAIFLLGMVVASLAGTIETLFLGWELVGLSSALLIAYFHNRPSPVVNGFRVWSIYRFADAAFLIAAVALHQMDGAGDFDAMLGKGTWPDAKPVLNEAQSLTIGLMLLIAAAGKSGLIPFSGWLPRAMEGPTPSSAVFYGALSVHLGTYLLLRVSPLLEQSLVLSVIVVALGLATAVFASLASRVQSDIKSSLAFASLTQVGIITAEIGLGLRYLPLIHMIGHACLRALQLLRAPSLIRDYQMLENAIGQRLEHHRPLDTVILPGNGRTALYRLAFLRGNFDNEIDRWIINPFLATFRWCDGMERRWTNFLAGKPSRESDNLPLRTGAEEIS